MSGGGEDVLCHQPEVLRCQGIDVGEYFVECAYAAFVHEAFGLVDGQLFAVLSAYGQLSMQLLFGSLELSLAEWFLSETAQFLLYHAQTPVYIVLVTAEIDGPDPCVGIDHGLALYGIDQSAPFSQSQVQARVQSWSTEDIVQEKKRPAARVVSRERGGAQHDVGLMGSAVAGDCF